VGVHLHEQLVVTRRQGLGQVDRGLLQAVAGAGGGRGGVGELEDLPAPMCAMGARQDRLYIVEGTWRTFVGNSRDEDGEFDVSQARVVFFDSAASASQALTTAQELVFEGFPQADEAVSFFWL